MESDAGTLRTRHVQPVLHRILRDEDVCKVVLSCQFAPDVLTMNSNVQMTIVRRWVGARSCWCLWRLRHS